jgi:hypothetical protein
MNDVRDLHYTNDQRFDSGQGSALVNKLQFMQNIRRLVIQTPSGLCQLEISRLLQQAYHARALQGGSLQILNNLTECMFSPVNATFPSSLSLSNADTFVGTLDLWRRREDLWRFEVCREALLLPSLRRLTLANARIHVDDFDGFQLEDCRGFPRQVLLEELHLDGCKISTAALQFIVSLTTSVKRFSLTECSALGSRDSDRSPIPDGIMRALQPLAGTLQSLCLYFNQEILLTGSTFNFENFVQLRHIEINAYFLTRRVTLDFSRVLPPNVETLVLSSYPYRYQLLGISNVLEDMMGIIRDQEWVLRRLKDIIVILEVKRDEHHWPSMSGDFAVDITEELKSKFEHRIRLNVEHDRIRKSGIKSEGHYFGNGWFPHD